MSKKDKEFGEWKGTCLVPNKVSVKRFEKGLIIKERNKEAERISMPLGTKITDMTDAINDYYSNVEGCKTNERRENNK